MPRKSNNHQFALPSLELRCMKALWALSAGTVHQIRSELLPDRPLAYTTVMTVMDRLARKGIVDRKKQGRAHLYRPAIAEETIRERALNQFVESYFQGSRNNLRRHLESRESGINPAPKIKRVVAKRAKHDTARAVTELQADVGMDASLL